MRKELETLSEHYKLREYLDRLKESGWHRIFLELDADNFLRLSNEPGLYVETGIKAHPNVNTALLMEIYGLDFDKCIIGGDNMHSFNQEFSKPWAIGLGFSPEFYQRLADACQTPNPLKVETFLLRQDLERFFPVIKGR